MAVVVTAASSRSQLKRILEKRLPDLVVLSYSEIATDVTVSALGMVSNEVLM